jgi:hypothetical protein
MNKIIPKNIDSNVVGARIVETEPPRITHFQKDYIKHIKRPWFGMFSDRNFMNSNIPLSTLPKDFKLEENMIPPYENITPKIYEHFTPFDQYKKVVVTLLLLLLLSFL